MIKVPYLVYPLYLLSTLSVDVIHSKEYKFKHCKQYGIIWLELERKVSHIFPDATPQS